MENKKNRFLDIAHASPNGAVFFPFSFMHKKNAEIDKSEFGFRLPENWQNLKNREENHLCIALFGGSAAYDYFSEIGERFTDLIGAKLNSYFGGDKKITVLNFGSPGYVLMNEIAAFVMYCDVINPDIVISHTGFNDFVFGQITDLSMQMKYNINYNPVYEFWSAVYHDKNYNECKNVLMPKVSAPIVIKSFLFRIRQFKNLVENVYDSKFIFGLQPYLFGKTKVSGEESRSFQETKNKQYSFLYNQLGKLYSELSINIDFEYENLNNLFSERFSGLTCFFDIVHQNKEANTVLSDYYSEIIINYLK